MNCVYQIVDTSAKVTAKTGRPWSCWISSEKWLGTARETTSSVIAKPNAVSLKPSRRDTDSLRLRNLGRESPATVVRLAGSGRDAPGRQEADRHPSWRAAHVNTVHREGLEVALQMQSGADQPAGSLGQLEVRVAVARRAVLGVSRRDLAPRMAPPAVH